jgi:hypothetical protein
MSGWTDADVDRLRWLDELGTSTLGIAKDLGRSERAVANKRHKLGLSIKSDADPLARFTTAQLQAEIERRQGDEAPGRRLADMVADRMERNGWTQADLARHLGTGTGVTSELVLGTYRLRPAMASRLARVFGDHPERWQQQCTEAS